MKDQIPALSDESKSVFYEGIALVLSRWSALQLAVDNEWGGRNSRQKADQIRDDIFSWFTLSTEPLYIDDLEEKLFEGLLSMNTEVDDGSIEEIAEKLMIMHEECLDGNFMSVEALRESSQRRVPVSHVRQAGDDDDDDDEDDDTNMDEEPSRINNNGSPKVIVESSKSSNSNSEDMVVDESVPKPSAEAEDGWVVVGQKRGKGKKK